MGVTVSSGRTVQEWNLRKQKKIVQYTPHSKRIVTFRDETKVVTKNVQQTNKIQKQPILIERCDELDKQVPTQPRQSKFLHLPLGQDSMQRTAMTPPISKLQREQSVNDYLLVTDKQNDPDSALGVPRSKKVKITKV